MWQKGYNLELALPALELGNDHDGAERLLLSDVHVVLDIDEQGGFKEKTWKADKTSQSASSVMSEVDHADWLIPETRFTSKRRCR